MRPKRTGTAAALLLAGLVSATCSEVRVDHAASTGTGGAGGADATGGPGGSGGVAEVDAGSPDAADAADGEDFPLDGGPACASRPATCEPGPQGPPDVALAAQTLDDLFFQCCGEVTCGCNAMCQTTDVVFDDGGCAVEMTVNGTIKPELADCLRDRLSEDRWICAPGQTVVHMPLCNPC